MVRCVLRLEFVFSTFLEEWNLYVYVYIYIYLYVVSRLCQGIGLLVE